MALGLCLFIEFAGIRKQKLHGLSVADLVTEGKMAAMASKSRPPPPPPP